MGMKHIANPILLDLVSWIWLSVKLSPCLELNFKLQHEHSKVRTWGSLWGKSLDTLDSNSIVRLK